MFLDDVLKDFCAFLHDDRVGFVNSITFTIHGGENGDVTFTCKPQSVE
jgi:hypothetical protein